MSVSYIHVRIIQTHCDQKIRNLVVGNDPDKRYRSIIEWLDQYFQHKIMEIWSKPQIKFSFGADMD